METLEKKASVGQNGSHCEICSVFVPNEASMKDHLRGKKHLRNVEFNEYRSKCAARSIYVSGLKSLPAAELTLADFFSSHGAVNKVTIDKTAKHYAIVEMDSVETVDKILENNKYDINGVVVDVRPRDVRPSKTKSKIEPLNQKYLSKETWDKLIACTDYDDQIRTLKYELILTKNDDHVRNLICQLLQTALDEAFPGCEVQPFGSSVNGFGVHGCDLDLNFEFEKIHPDIKAGFSSTIESDTADDKTGSLCDKTRSQNEEILVTIAEIIKQCVPDCQKIKTILSARLPVVRFHHKGSGMRCDISLKNNLALVNTRYLQLCCKLNNNFTLLVFVIRAWMKHWKLAGNTHFNGANLNNYAVTLLALFYMQSLNYIPKLKEVRRLSGSTSHIQGFDCTIPTSVDEVLVNFEIPEIPIIQLVSGFFNFYSMTEFEKVVLDLSINEFVCLDEDKRKYGMVSEVGNFKYGALNIRDPFELTHNVAANVNQKHMKTFIRCIRNSTLVSKMKKYAQKPVTGGAVWGVMMMFVDQHNKEEVGGGICSPNKGKCAEYSFCISPLGSENGFDTVCQIASDYVISVLQDVFFVEMENVNNVQLFDQIDSNVCFVGFKDKTVQNSTTVAVSIAKTEVALNNDEDHILNPRKRHAETNRLVCRKRSKVATISPPEVHRNPIKLPTTISCTATKKVWQGRRRARRQIVQTGLSDLVQLERKISELLLSESNASMPEGNLNDSSSSDISTPLQFNLSLSEENNKLKLVFQTEDVSTDFMSFFHHVEVFLPNFITKCLKRM